MTRPHHEFNTNGNPYRDGSKWISPHTNLLSIEPNDLARLAKTGSPSAFAELVRRYRPGLLRVLEKRLHGHVDDAEDIAQETLTRAWQKIRSFDERYRFATWLYTIAIRLAIDKGRRRKAIYLAADPVDQTSLGPQAFDRRDDSHNLWATAHQVLSSSGYTALWLRYGEDLSVTEIAKVLGKTKVGVRVTLHRARQTLAPHLLKFMEHEENLQRDVAARGEIL